MFRPLSKLAEPPPPEGVSTKEWDRQLAKGPTSPLPTVVSVRKHAAAAQRAAFDEIAAGTGEVRDVPTELQRAKVAAAADGGLLDFALSRRSTVGGGLALYEAMGGLFKEAFGSPVFQAPKSPSLATGGAGMRPRSAGSLPSVGRGAYAAKPPTVPSTPSTSTAPPTTNSVGLDAGQ